MVLAKISPPHILRLSRDLETTEALAVAPTSDEANLYILLSSYGLVKKVVIR
jgi:hypothetical protein